MAVLGRPPVRHRVDVVDEATEIAAAIRYYRDLLAEPARRPWRDDDPLVPSTIGPVWEIDATGHWVLPEFTAGWGLLGHLSYWLNPAYIGKARWEFTAEQARGFLWRWAVDPSGEWRYIDGVLQRVKGHGKDPIIATEALGVANGPSWVEGVDERTGEVIARQHSNPLIMVAATSADQTKTTMGLFPALITDAYRAAYGIQVLKTMVTSRGGVAEITSVTRNPEKLEGFRTYRSYLNETQHWRDVNSGAAMEAVIRRNRIKVPRATSLRCTNAPKMGSGSVAETDRDAYDTGQHGERFLYDSLEAHRDAKLDAEDGVRVIPMVRGDSTWLTVEMFMEGINDPHDSDETKRRYWYNQVGGADEAFLERQAWLDCPAAIGPDAPGVGDEVVLFGDGSKSGDYTALVGCRIRDGAVFVVGIWKPGSDGLVDRAAVSRAVALAMKAYSVIGLWWDPSPAQDEDLEQSYWTTYCDAWAEQYGDRLKLRASTRHAVIWDMRWKINFRDFVGACEQFVDDVERALVPHTHDKRLTRHMLNAVRHYTDHGIALRKVTRHSSKKIDAAVCAIGARHMRRLVVLNPDKYLPKTHRVV